MDGTDEILRKMSVDLKQHALWTCSERTRRLEQAIHTLERTFRKALEELQTTVKGLEKEQAELRRENRKLRDREKNDRRVTQAPSSDYQSTRMAPIPSMDSGRTNTMQVPNSKYKSTREAHISSLDSGRTNAPTNY
jgi:regulator of replication initiation timing